MSARAYPRIKMHSNNATHRRTAMIAKDLILTKDNCRISVKILRDHLANTRSATRPPN
jgi:hypothetical protein